MKKAIFLDQATSYHPLKEVLDVLKKTIHPHCLSPIFQNKDFFLEKNRCLETIRSYFGIKKEESFRVTSGGEQAISEILDLHYYKEIFHSGKQHILIAKTDQDLFASGLEKLSTLGVVHDYLESDEKGHITCEILLEAITPRTSLVMLSWVNPLTGVIQPIGDLIKLCHEKGIRCHVDVSHVIGKLYFNLEDIHIDYMTFDAKPFHGPYKVGGFTAQGLIENKEEPFPLQLEALQLSLAHAQDKIDTMNLEIARLRNSFEKKILQKIPSAKILLQDVERLPNISVIAFPYVASEYLLYLLAQDRVYASIGNEILLETLLSEIGIESMLAKCSISFSFSHETTEEELEIAIEAISKRYSVASKLLATELESVL